MLLVIRLIRLKAKALPPIRALSPTYPGQSNTPILKPGHIQVQNLALLYVTALDPAGIVLKFLLHGLSESTQGRRIMAKAPVLLCPGATAIAVACLPLAPPVLAKTWNVALPTFLFMGAPHPLRPLHCIPS